MLRDSKRKATAARTVAAGRLVLGANLLKAEQVILLALCEALLADLRAGVSLDSGRRKLAIALPSLGRHDAAVALAASDLGVLRRRVALWMGGGKRNTRKKDDCELHLVGGFGYWCEF